ncbi:MAG: glutamate--tRNA ligase [Defluviitaleaceae bacterium]|nr:glutamate--tRNA ligase [Defluviitaleaceae bacterium]
MQYRTRFAPSPTGYMHLGGLRTALYAYLYAKGNNGAFILRIEDTDQERQVEGTAEVIYKTLTEVGLIYDEGPDVGGPCGPYVQSERIGIYREHAEMLIKRGHAYYCFCGKEELDEQRLIHQASRVSHKYNKHCVNLSPEEITKKLSEGTSYVIRQNVSEEGKVFFNDCVYGRIDVDNSTLEDQIILKSDGFPTYNFANVVDDRLMGVTHVIRGNEFLSSTPKHVLLYEGFGWEPPVYIHVPPIMRTADKKLSKRDGDAYYGDFITKGYLKEAIINYIALLGWSPGGEKELFSLPELVEAFDISGISKSPAIFDIKKLDWLNGEYLRAMDDAEFHARALPYIKEGVKRETDTALIAKLLKDRIERLTEIPGQLDFIDTLPEYSSELYTHKKMKTDAESVRPVMPSIASALENVSDWRQEAIHEALMALVECLGCKNGQVLWPLRVALSGKAQTPGGGIEIALILGKEETLTRIRRASDKLNR